MANLEILDDTVVTIPIQTKDAEGNVVPPTAGDTFSASSSLPNSLAATIGADGNGNPTLILTPLVQASPGITVTVTDKDNLPALTQVCDIVPDLTPNQIFLDVAGETTAPQAVPPNAGP